MRRILSALIIISTGILTWAQPLLVGHRGSYWGVENTAEAFINGAKKGYQLLECDVKVAGDGTLVLSHDDTTNRLGGSLTIASATLTQLKAESYTQTRGGVTYTASICTLAEYLDICAEYNVIPVIELKWATGINSNDCSGIPALITAIEAKGFRNKCVILTSMKPCLEYIRKKYPDITLQFLTGQYWANHFDWCVEHGIDVDIEAGYFDKETVTKYHDAGLKVNMWTANTNATYKTYGNYGCDFITTDYLDPASLPELDANVLFPPNTTDYPNVSGIIHGFYNPETITSTEALSTSESVVAERALLRNGKWYVLENNSASGEYSKINVYDAQSGELLRSLDMTGVSGGTTLISDIAFTADGVLLGCNLATVPYSDEGDSWKIYQWTSDEDSPQLFAEITTAEHLGNWNSAIAGDALAVSGRLNDLKVYVNTYSATAETRTFRIVGMQFTKGVRQSAVYALNNDSYTEAAWGRNPSIIVSPSSRDNLIIDSNLTGAREYTFNWNESRTAMTECAILPDSIIASASSAMSFLRYSNKVYAYVANLADGKLSSAMYDATKSLSELNAVSTPLLKDASMELAPYYATGIELANGHINLYTYIHDRGFSMHSVKVVGDTISPDENAQFALDTIWQNSTATANAPQHIDGTNAQQGGAANGLFYVNDCVDKKIYIFDKTGCLGGIDGGAGWGCALDDAGNIIVRNDKNTTQEHSFIIYAAGTTINNVPTPISIDVTVPLEGQTNFISASGDVLGTGGHIYMYPNGQTAINIVTLADGKVIKTTASEEISMKGTTAGYVIPLYNNTENWLYQIRTTGFYTYNGGQNDVFLTGRSSTSVPGRNSTVGGEYFTLAGHEIFIHNSGANYKGGFTIRNLTRDEVITSVSPIGTLGYETGGNYSVANWIFAEPIDANSCYIYQYCPANGMAVYRLYNINATGVDKIADNTPMQINIYPNPTYDKATISSNDELGQILVYNISGAQTFAPIEVIDSHKATIDLSHLPSGIYIIKSNNNPAIKLIKK